MSPDLLSFAALNQKLFHSLHANNSNKSESNIGLTKKVLTLQLLGKKIECCPLPFTQFTQCNNIKKSFTISVSQPNKIGTKISTS